MTRTRERMVAAEAQVVAAKAALLESEEWAEYVDAKDQYDRAFMVHFVIDDEIRHEGRADLASHKREAAERMVVAKAQMVAAKARLAARDFSSRLRADLSESGVAEYAAADDQYSR